MMKVLDIPLHLQAEGSVDCGPTGSLMILDYFGVTNNAAEVIAKVPKCNFGTSSFDNALTLMDYGLEVEMVLAQPQLFDGNFIREKPSNQAILQQIETVKDKEKDREKQDIIASFATYLQKKGKVRLVIPTKEIIIAALDEGKAVWVSMYARVLGKNEGGYHTVVIAGYKDDQFLILNPWPLSRQKSWEHADDVVYGIHVSTLFDYDNGTILLVSQK